MSEPIANFGRNEELTGVARVINAPGRVVDRTTTGRTGVSGVGITSGAVTIAVTTGRITTNTLVTIASAVYNGELKAGVRKSGKTTYSNRCS